MSVNSLDLTQQRSVYGINHSFPHDDIRWIAAEQRTAELLSLIEPNSHSERRRKAVSDYVKDLIQKCLDCQVSKFGSVPLKTYLPDGDIDLTTFSRHANLKDTWANDVQAVLKYEEHRKDAGFCVREVQCIPAEVKIVKCLVEGIVVDISFNQLGGLSTLCFLEEVDRLIQKDHLFKRSIILVKAWCYYESRLLGAHHGLISTYALETLVLYIFNVFHATLRSPLEVLFTFMDYFSSFNWEKYCVSIWGPIPLASTSVSSAEPPLISEDDFLLSKGFLEACRMKYNAISKGQDLHARVFGEKFLNVLDPLQINNNLGRSVSKASYFRIRSAFRLGARKLAKVFQSSDENFTMYLDDFFSNTWERHQSGARRDAPDSTFPPLQILSCKEGGFDAAHDVVIDETCSAAQKCSDMRQSLHKANTNDAWEISAEGAALFNFASTPLKPSTCCSTDYRENASMDTNMHVKVQQDTLSSNDNSLTDSLAMVKNPRQIPQCSLRRTVSEGRLERLSDIYSFGNMAVKPNSTEGLGKLGASNNYNSISGSKPVVSEEMDHLQGCGTDTFQRGNSIKAGSKSVNERLFDGHSQTLVDRMILNNSSHEERNIISKFPIMQTTVHTHDQSHIPYVYFPGYTSQPGTFMFSPFSAFSPPLQSGELNLGNVNGLMTGSSAVTLPIPFISPTVHIQAPRGPVPSLLPYSSGVQSMASIPQSHINIDSSKTPFHSQKINELEQPEKQEQPQTWSYANGSLNPSQVLDFNIGNADAGSASKHRKAPQVAIQDRKACIPLQLPSSTVSKLCVSNMDEFSTYPSSSENPFCKITSASNLDCRVMNQTSSDLATAQELIIHPEGFHSSSVELPSPTGGTVMELGLGSQRDIDSTMCFPVGTFPIFPYYNPSYSAKPDVQRSFEADNVKGMSQYSRHDYAYPLYDIGSPSIYNAYHDTGEIPNGSDSDSTSRIESATEGGVDSKSDFLCSDLAHHLQDLEFGRSCQEPAIDQYVPNYIPNPFDLKVLPYIPFQKIPGFTQYPVPSNPMLAFNHMHLSNVSPQLYACSINDSQRQQIGTRPFFPSRRSLYNNDMQCFAERYPQESGQYDHRSGAARGLLRQRNVMSRGFDRNNGNGNSEIPGAPHKVAGGKHIDRNNTWRKSHHLSSSCLPMSSGFVAPPFHGPSKEVSGFHLHTRVQDPERAFQLSSYDVGGVPPLVPQLEFGSLGPINCPIPSEQDHMQPIMFSTNSEALLFDEEQIVDSL